MGSFLPWGSLTLVQLFLLLHPMFHRSSGCSVEERAALMDLRSSLMRVRSLAAPDSWGKDDHDCCSWERVNCSNTTQRVTHLNISSVTDGAYWYLNSTMFSVFHELRYLDLSYNRLRLGVAGLVGLSKLRYLELSETMSGGVFPEFIGKIVSLEVLVLNGNDMDGVLPSTAFENLIHLRQLNMSVNSFSGILPDSLFALPNLKVLDLSLNAFSGHIPVSSISGPISLEVLDVSYNQLNGIQPVKAFENVRNLHLAGNQFSGSLPASLFALPHLKFLDLSYNNFEERFPISLTSEPVPLEELYLDDNKMSGPLPTKHAFENLQNIRALSLRFNNFSGTMRTFAFEKMQNLQELYLDSNQFSGDITALVNLQNLRELSLSINQFSGTIPTFLFSLPHIERLNLSTNFFGGPIPINPSSNLSLLLKSLRISQNNLSGRFSFFSLGELTKLEEVDLSGNANLVIDVHIPGWTPLFQLKELVLSGCDLDKNIIAEPHFLRTQHHLEVLDLSNNNLSGNMPNWLFTQNTALRWLLLGNNSLTGSVDPVWYTQSYLEIIYINMNRLIGQLPTNISSMFPSLVVLDVSSNYFSGNIPTSLCKIKTMQFVDLSNNKLSGEVPPCLFSSSNDLVVLKVSNNKLGGQIFGGVNSKINAEELYMDRNKFEGEVPHNLSGDRLHVVDLHDNELSGRLNASLWDISSLAVLNLAGNRITGNIHPNICGIAGIRLLDLSSNNLTGSVPNCSFTLLNFLNLSVNSLSGDFSYTLFNTTSLLALDIRRNQFTGNLHWLSYLDKVRLLSSGRNKFEGQITPNLCTLMYLRIVDLSHNKLSGSLPACIGNISFKGETDDQIFQSIILSFGEVYSSFYDLTVFTFATKGNLYTYGRNFFDSMSGIDMSANMLDGEIPWELGNLSHIKSLNLSNNFFVGPIPTTFGSMEEIESLDLSHNELSGPIPWQLTQLSSLGVFSVEYNNLSGCIPNSGQLESFGMESYLANTNLHNITQGNMCTPGPDPVVEEDVGETHDPVLYAITAAAFVLAFWATVGFSFCHPYGRSIMLKM